MGKLNQVTVAIREKPSERPRKITKLSGYNEGGFGIITPYHQVESGFIGKIPVDYNVQGNTYIPDKDILGFKTTHRVKLSYHNDGFVQFSGEIGGKVISGRDKETGEIKGVGLLTHPLSDPIRSGPSFGIQTWGLENFEELGNSSEAVIFEPEDLYFRDCEPNSQNAYLLEVFIFPINYWAAVQKRGQNYTLSICLPSSDAPYSIFDLKVLHLANQNVLLAGIMSNIHMSWPNKSGWMINGPGSYDSSGRGLALMAWYPDLPSQPKDLQSLDYVPDDDN